MTTDTVFDLASLTKPIATATSVMKLVEDGQIRLSDPIAKFIPEFAENGKAEVTIQQLLTHQGGLIPDNSIRDYESGPGRGIPANLLTQADGGAGHAIYLHGCRIHRACQSG